MWLNTVLVFCEYMSFAKSWQEKGCSSQAETYISKWKIYIYYIHTEKYSPKSGVVNLDTQMSSSQSEEWTMVFTCEKNDTSNQNRERCLKMIRPIRSHRGVWVSRQNYCLFLQLAERRFAHIRRERFFSKSLFSLKKWKTFQNWSGIVSLFHCR